MTSQLNQIRNPAKKLEMTKKQSKVYITSIGVNLFKRYANGSYCSFGSYIDI